MSINNKKLIVFYCHNFGGLGHTKRISIIISEILENFGEYYSVIFINSGEKQDFLFSKNKSLKIINLPQYEFKNYKKLDNIKNKNLFLYRANIFKKLFSLGNTQKLILEHFPFGRNFLLGEILGIISFYRKYNPNSYVFSSVRDIFDLKSLNKNNLKIFDRFLIHSDKKLISYTNSMDVEIKKKIIYTGYVVHKNNKKINTKKDFIVISLSGGQDGLEYVFSFLKILKKLDYDLKVYINLGLLYSEENILKLKKSYNYDIEIKDYFENFIELKLSAKLVVSMGSYNNLTENLYYNIKTIVYTRKTDREQISRLNIFKKISENIYKGESLNSVKLRKILEKNIALKKSGINFNGGYFSASFISNFGKYKYLKTRLTNLCNAKCEMCGVIKRKWNYNNNYKLKNSILDFYKIGGNIVNYTGGEPTIYKGFWDLLYLSKKLGLITSVSTNGTTLGDTFFEKLYKNGFRLIDYIDISVDGLYDLQDIRRKYKGLFEKISSNIGKILKNHIYLHINVTIRNDNISEMIDIFNFFKKKKINSISFGMIASDPLNDNTYLIPSIKQLEKFYFKDIKKILNSSGNIKINFSPEYDKKYSFKDFTYFVGEKNSFPKPIGEKCSFIKGKKEIRINEGGDLAACCVLDDFDNGLGNINKSNLLNIVCSKNYEEFLNKRFPYISNACLNCKIIRT